MTEQKQQELVEYYYRTKSVYETGRRFTLSSGYVQQILRQRGVEICRPTSVVYFIQAVQSKLVKIGVSVNVEQRLKTLQSGSPEKLEVVRILKNSGRLRESELHRQCAKYRKHGEWFAPEVLNLI
jgi:hypothetical protein